MKLGMTVGMRGNDPRAFAQYARRLEDAWVEYLWTGEAYNADAVSTMGFLAAVTERAPIEANGYFTEPDWREVICADGVRCFVARRDGTAAP